MKKSIPEIREREGNEKSIPEIREREGNEKIHSHNSGTGIRGFHSWEWTGTGIPAHPCMGLGQNCLHLRLFYSCTKLQQRCTSTKDTLSTLLYWVRGSIPKGERKAHKHSRFATSAKCTGNHDLFLMVLCIYN